MVAGRTGIFWQDDGEVSERHDAGEMTTRRDPRQEVDLLFDEGKPWI